MSNGSMAQVLTTFLSGYRKTHTLSPQQAKVVNCLRCNHCGKDVVHYHSCRNRHCSRCQKSASEKWLARQCEDLLPVPYHHLVFTLPHELNGWVRLHPRVIYRLLFEAVWGTLKVFGQDPKRLNGQLGMTGVLHTWGQNLSQHVHLHCPVPGGALSLDGAQWHPTKSTYLFPVKALSRHYRGRLVSLLRQVWCQGELTRVTANMVSPLLDTLMKKEWVVFSRSTLQRSQSIVKYLARYTHRIALSERRIEYVDAQGVDFRWKDYANNGQTKIMHLSGEEFVRRFLLHVLPSGFMRIGHYGFLANSQRRRKLVLIRACLNAESNAETVITTEKVASDDTAVCWCPYCKKGILLTLRVLAACHKQQNPFDP